MSKFKPGDKITIINYGHIQMSTSLEQFQKFHNSLNKHWDNFMMNLMWGVNSEFKPEYKEIDYTKIFPIIQIDENGWVWYDTNPEIVGREAFIKERKESQGKFKYSLEGIPEKCAWYNEDQLKLVE